MWKALLNFLDNRPKLTLLLAGGLTSFSFAPYFFWPLLLLLSSLPYIISQKALTWKDAFKFGWIFGWGFFLINLYWITIGVSVYIDQFWWALPISLFGLPAFLAIYIGLVGLGYWFIKDKIFSLNVFACLWVIAEIARGYFFTGFPWNLAAYSFSFSEVICQITSVIGSFGLSLIVVYSFSSGFYFLKKDYKVFLIQLLIIGAVWGGVYFYGANRLNSYPTQFSNVKIRIVQPSIEQTNKWTSESFWDNFMLHKKLSLVNNGFNPDIILWPEAAVTVPPSIKDIIDQLRLVVTGNKSVLVTGGVTDNLGITYKREKLFTSMYALKQNGPLIFEYHKSHLVPFGEYMPYSNILPLKKITPGFQDYSAGKPGFTVSIPELGLKIKPLICYEVVFPNEVKIHNSEVDIIFNITNDAWYGDSGGPYQHFYTTRMRAIENGLPLVRSANNGISAIIDPVGRIVRQTQLNSIVILDSFLPLKINKTTIFSEIGNSLLYLYLVCSAGIAYLLTQRPPKNNVTN